MKALCGLWNLPSPERSGCGGPRTLQTGPVPLLGFRANSCLEFFLFLFLFFFDFSKIYVLFIFFQKCHPAAGSSGGRLLPPDEPAVGWVRAGSWWAGTYRRFNRR